MSSRAHRQEHDVALHADPGRLLEHLGDRPVCRGDHDRGVPAAAPAGRDGLPHRGAPHRSAREHRAGRRRDRGRVARPARRHLADVLDRARSRPAHRGAGRRARRPDRDLRGQRVVRARLPRRPAVRLVYTCESVHGRDRLHLEHDRRRKDLRRPVDHGSGASARLRRPRRRRSHRDLDAGHAHHPHRRAGDLAAAARTRGGAIARVPRRDVAGRTLHHPSLRARGGAARSPGDDGHRHRGPVLRERVHRAALRLFGRARRVHRGAVRRGVRSRAEDRGTGQSDARCLRLHLLRRGGHGDRSPRAGGAVAADRGAGGNGVRGKDHRGRSGCLLGGDRCAALREGRVEPRADRRVLVHHRRARREHRRRRPLALPDRSRGLVPHRVQHALAGSRLGPARDAHRSQAPSPSADLRGASRQLDRTPARELGGQSLAWPAPGQAPVDRCWMSARGRSSRPRSGIAT